MSVDVRVILLLTSESCQSNFAQFNHKMSLLSCGGAATPFQQLRLCFKFLASRNDLDENSTLHEKE
ncbi:MAG: hypothetical protein A3C44_04940 [Gammaproteobacteria bacterium RIFCSPHIGHO2_02_FULL_39_13]|nr:MAG: hypothetical protein A3C44_04940 [Gammaproteobacteria bacterium RIFCSPHIGHO2_02_FULL_39_13]